MKKIIFGLAVLSTLAFGKVVGTGANERNTFYIVVETKLDKLNNRNIEYSESEAYREAEEYFYKINGDTQPVLLTDLNKYEVNFETLTVTRKFYATLGEWTEGYKRKNK